MKNGPSRRSCTLRAIRREQEAVKARYYEEGKPTVTLVNNRDREHLHTLHLPDSHLTSLTLGRAVQSIPVSLSPDPIHPPQDSSVFVVLIHYLGFSDFRNSPKMIGIETYIKTKR